MQVPFIDWLKAQPSDPDAHELLAFQSQTPSAGGAGRPTEFQTAITAINPPPANLTNLLQALSRLEQRWIAEPPAGWFRTLLSRVTLGGIALVLFGTVIALILWRGVFTAEFLTQLADPAKARGLITFLFSLSSIAIFLLVAIAVFWVREIDNRFTQAKDLLSILVGILGTVLGFYFASPNSNGTPSLSVSALELSSPVVVAGQTSNLRAMLSGGKPPYLYSLRFTSSDASIPPEKLKGLERLGKSSVNGAITEAVKIPDDISKATLNVILSGEDSDGQHTQLLSTLIVVPLGTPPSGQPSQ